MDAVKNADSGADYNSGTPHSYSKHKGVAGFSMNDDEDDVYDSSVLGIANKSSAVEQFDSDGDDNYETATGSVRTKNTRKSSKQTINASVDSWLESTVGRGKVQQRCPTDRRMVLDGFSLAALEREIVSIPFPTPQAPKGFRPGHVFPEDLRTSNSSSGSSSGSSGRLVANRRMGEGGAATSAMLLGETEHNPTQSTSVFDLIGEESRKKILSAINGRSAMQSQSNVPNMSGEQTVSREGIFSDTEKDKDQGSTEGATKTTNSNSRPMLTSDTLLKSTFAGLSQAFQNRFVSSSATSADPVSRAGLASAEQYSSISDVTQSAVTFPISGSNSGSLKHIEGSTASYLGDMKPTSAQTKQAVLDKYSSEDSSKSLPPLPSLLLKERVPVVATVLPLSTPVPTPLSSSSPSLCSAKTILKGKANRQSREWYPTPLLSRRFHIKVDGLKVGMKNGRMQGVGSGESVVDSRLEGMFAGMREKEKEKEKVNTQHTNSHNNNNNNNSSNISSNNNSGMRSDSIRVIDNSKVASDQQDTSAMVTGNPFEEEALVKPPMSLFKSIFEASDSDSDSDSDDSDEEEEDKHEKQEVAVADQQRDDPKEKGKDVVGGREGQTATHSRHKTETLLKTIKANKSSGSLSTPLTASAIATATTSVSTDSSAAPVAAVKSSSGGDYLRKRFGTESVSGSEDRIQQSSVFSGVVPHPILSTSSNTSGARLDTVKEKEGMKGKGGMKKIERIEEVEEEEEEEEEVTRMVFRKPVAKARVNAFGSKPKAKRTFSIRYDEDDDEEEGDKKGDEEEGGSGAGMKDKEKEREKVTEGMRFAGKAPVLKRRRVASELSKDDPEYSAMSEATRLRVEMEEGVKEEVEREKERKVERAREVERERAAANALAAGAFFSNMTENVPHSLTSAAIQEAELAANNMIDLAEQTETEDLQMSSNVVEGNGNDGRRHNSDVETIKHAITLMKEQRIVKEETATAGRQEMVTAESSEYNTTRDIGKKHHRDREKKEKDRKKDKEKDKEKERKSKDKDSKKKKKSSRLDDSPDTKKDKKHKNKSSSKRSREESDHTTHSHTARTVHTAVLESDRSSSSGGDSGED